MKQCQWCNNQFVTKISYQIYCSSECRDEAAREKIAERYLISRRQKRIGKVRPCKSCGKGLSVYNDDALCDECLINPHELNKALKEIRGIANGKSFEDED
jgi:uncharacterized protein YmfQ (DUF2313 family)